MSGNDLGKGETVVFRPVRLLSVVSAFSALLVIATVGIAVGLGAEVRANFTPLQTITLLIFVAFIVVLIMALGLSYGRAERDGFAWRNGIRTHRVEWSEIRGLVFRSGDPWAYLLVESPNALSDEPRRIAVMAIQSTDRASAHDKADRLRGLIAERR